MPSSIEVVQRIEDYIEALEPLYIEPRILDVCMVCFELDVRVEFGGGLFRDLARSVVSVRIYGLVGTR